MKFLLLLLVTLPQIVLANHTEKKWGVGFDLGAAFPMGDSLLNKQVDTGLAGGLNLTHYFKPEWGLGFSYDRTEWGNSEALNEAFTLNAIRRFDYKKWTPFLNAGLGVGTGRKIAGNTSRYSTPALKAGLGIERSLSQALTLAAKVNYHYLMDKTAAPTEVHSVIPTLGLNYYWGPRVAKVTSQKPQDSDQDGIIDSLDQCPHTATRTAVNSAGCAKQQSAQILLNVQFATNSATVQASYDAEMQRVAAFMNKYPDTKAEIEGHTDNRGSESYNTRLSQRRADSVRDYLVKKLGIDSDRLTAKGYGPSRPTTENDSAAGRQANRRVVATFKGQ